MEDDERFDRARAEQILGRAARMDADRQVTLGELTAAAEEVGLDAALVRRAAAEVRVDAAESGRTLGMQTRVIRRRVISRRFDAAGLNRLMTRLDAEFGAQGTRTVDDDTASWNGRHIQVTLEPADDGGTVVQISEPFTNTTAQLGILSIAGGGSAGLMAGLIFGKALGLTKAVMLPFALPFIIILSLLALHIVRRSHARTVARAAESFERALDTIERASRQTSAVATEEQQRELSS